jgi:putative sterol carrier protein
MPSIREIFETHLPKGIGENVDKAREIDAIYQFNITGDDEMTWVVDLTKDADWVTEGPSDDAQCTIEVAGEDWLGIMSGDLNAMEAFMTGKLRVSGDMGLATKLQTVFSMAG